MYISKFVICRTQILVVLSCGAGASLGRLSALEWRLSALQTWSLMAPYSGRFLLASQYQLGGFCFCLSTPLSTENLSWNVKNFSRKSRRFGQGHMHTGNYKFTYFALIVRNDIAFINGAQWASCSSLCKEGC